MLPKHADGLSIDPHACAIGIYLAGMPAAKLFLPYSFPGHLYYTVFIWFQKFHSGEDEDEPSNSPDPQSLEIFQNLDVDSIARAIGENTRRAIFSIIPGTSVLLAHSEQPQLENITSSAPAFHHIGNIELNKAICLVIDRLLGWERKAGGSPPPMVDPADLNLFHSGNTTGPTENNFRLDWTASPHSSWNLAASFLFADHFLEWARSSSSMINIMLKHKMSRTALSLAFRKRLYRLQALFWKVHADSSGPVKSAGPNSIVNQAALERRRGRQKRLFQTRQDIILAHPEWDSTYWDAHEALGIDGTSADESETETGNNRFWRVPHDQ
ncbi:hypothetical protein M422DRAFT_71082 [Sphaerobolus stellatus SS14]|uniref:Unplaced genomic scaffold SPHSTscaffold_195, whole genome shotgun sequence n=1 Tax=Sphaerobolus stellatus (strain SS14) TaxID=990650 RepID=A0A0C9UY35_SPHS4|nr:hypothetical protein M422DRAFT_71082 [Sphaerobolus stellatus SS14]